MMPLGLYLAVVCSDELRSLSQPYAFTAASRLVNRPSDDSRPAVALPLLYSMMSGAEFELSTWLAVDWICWKLFASNFTLAPVSFSNSEMAAFQAMPIALVSPS